MVNFFKQYKFLVISSLVYALIFSALSLWRHATFQTQTWDLAAFEQSLWNTLHGHFLFNNFENTSHFAIHFSPWLLLLMPIYALWPGPHILLLLQSLALAAGAWPLYFLSKKIINQKWANVIVLLYLLYPSLHWVNLFDWHPVTFAIPLFLAWFYFWQAEKYLWAAAMMAAAVSTEEDMIVAAFFVGLFMLTKKQYRPGLMVMGLTGAYFLLATKVLMPAFGGGLVRLDRYAQFGGTASGIAASVILQPSLTAATLFQWSKLQYIGNLLLPVAFLPLLAPLTLILLIPGLLQNLLTNFSLQFSNVYQYDSILIPFIFVGVIWAVNWLLTKKMSEKVLLPLVVFCAVTGFIWYSPLSPKNFPWPKFFNSRTADFNKLVAAIPATASVAAHTNLVPHLTHRANIYMAGYEPTLMDYVILDSQDLFGFQTKNDLDSYLDNYAQTGEYDVVVIDQRYYVIKRKALPST